MTDYDCGNSFLLSWDCEGLEACINLTDIDRDTVFSILADKKPTSLHYMVSMLMLRAQANPQRHYEVYAVSVEDGITEDDLKGMFNDDPQAAANLIRDRGRKLYSNRRDPSKIKIV